MPVFPLVVLPSHKLRQLYNDFVPPFCPNESQFEQLYDAFVPLFCPNESQFEAAV